MKFNSYASTVASSNYARSVFLETSSSILEDSFSNGLFRSASYSSGGGVTHRSSYSESQIYYHKNIVNFSQDYRSTKDGNLESIEATYVSSFSITDSSVTNYVSRSTSSNGITSSTSSYALNTTDSSISDGIRRTIVSQVLGSADFGGSTTLETWGVSTETFSEFHSVNTRSTLSSYNYSTTYGSASTEYDSQGTRTFNDSFSFWEQSFATVRRGSDTLAFPSTIVNYSTSSGSFSVYSQYSTSLLTFEESRDSTITYSVENGQTYKIETINSFVENYEDPLEGFWIFTHDGSFEPNPASYTLVPFSSVFTSTFGEFSYFEAITSSDLGDTALVQSYGNSVAGTTFTITQVESYAIIYGSTQSSQASLDSTYSLEFITTLTLSIPDQTSFIAVSDNRISNFSLVMDSITSVAPIKAYSIIAIDPKNYESTTFNSYYEFTTTYLKKDYGLETAFDTGVVSSSASTSSPYSYSDSYSVNGASSMFSSTESYQETRGSSYSFSQDYTRSESNKSVEWIVTNGGELHGEGDFYAIIPDHIKGFVGFSEGSLYGNFSSSMSATSSISLRLKAYSDKNYNRSKVSLECIPFVDYEEFSVSQNSVSSSTLGFTSTGLQTTGVVTKTIYDTFSTVNTFSVSYMPNYTLSSSLINDKLLVYSYSLTRRSTNEEGSTTESNQVSLKLFNSCSHTRNFRLDRHEFGGNSFIGGCAYSNLNWTLYYRGHLNITKYNSLMASTSSSLFNSAFSMASEVFSHGEIIAVSSLPLVKFGSQHYYQF